MTDETMQPPPCADHGYNRLECPECGDARRIHYEELERDLEQLEASDPAVGEAAARLDEATAAILAKARTMPTEPTSVELARVEQELEAARGDDMTDFVAALRRVEQERDEANDFADKIAAELRLVTRERDSLARRCAVRFEETQSLEAELASARAELERLRYSGWIVARDGGRDCGNCGQEIRRGEAYTTDTVRDVQTHVHCPTEGEPA